jgi:hypothetical protein
VTNAADVPGFKTNPLKTKRFIERLKFGVNIQFNPTTKFLPSSSTIGLQLFYKLTVKSDIGVGASNIIGMGNSVNNLHLSNQGFNLRSFFDYKLESFLYTTAAFEKNYTPVSSMKVKYSELNYSNGIWTTSVLAGLTQKYRMKKQTFGTISFLYDFLHDQHIPPTPAIVCRIGWEL